MLYFCPKPSKNTNTMLNKCLFPIYDTIDKQFRNRINCQDSDLSSFIYPGYYLPAFFFMRPKRPDTISSLKIFDINGTQVAVIAASRLHIVTTAMYDGIGYTGGILRNESTINANGRYINETLPCGVYYYELTEANTGKKYYSEVWRVVDNAVATSEDEHVINGTFLATMAAWTTTGTWGVSGGVANYTGGIVGNDVVLYQPISAGYSPLGYQVSFTITNYSSVGPANYLQVRTVSGNTSQSILVTGNGTYTFYVDRLECIEVYLYGFSFNFSIDNISAKMISGLEGIVTIYLANRCKVPNNIDDRYFYYNVLMLDALVIEPEYGEELKQEENGDIEKVNSFVRAFKRHRIDPMLLSEPVTDAISQLNAFDTGGIHDGGRDIFYQLFSDTPDYVRRNVSNFESSFEWQEGQCYCIVRTFFDENLAIKDKCCDSNTDIEPCFDGDTEIEIALSLNCDTKIFNIYQSNTPTGLGGAFVKLYYKKIANDDYEGNCGFAATVLYSGINIPYAEFIANGIDFYAADAADYVYAFYVQLTQIGCDDTISSPVVCRGVGEIGLNVDNLSCSGNQNTIAYTVSTPAGYGSLVVELYNDLTGGWEYGQAVSDANGANLILLPGTLCSNAAHLIKIRVREGEIGLINECDRTSAQVDIALPNCC